MTGTTWGSSCSFHKQGHKWPKVLQICFSWIHSVLMKSYFWIHNQTWMMTYCHAAATLILWSPICHPAAKPRRSWLIKTILATPEFKPAKCYYLILRCIISTIVNIFDLKILSFINYSIQHYKANPQRAWIITITSDSLMCNYIQWVISLMTEYDFSCMMDASLWCNVSLVHTQ